MIFQNECIAHGLNIKEIMKARWIFILFPMVFFAGCEHEEPAVPAIMMVGNSICKSNGLKAIADRSANQDCVVYSWLKGDTLTIRHINAAFNCCPDGLSVTLRVDADTLIVSEAENAALCDCNCLYDLDWQLTGITGKAWWVRIEEPYVKQQDQQKILFRADLKKYPVGEFCLTRNEYPWGF